MLPTQSKTKSLGGMWEMVVIGFNLYHYSAQSPTAAGWLLETWTKDSRA